MKKKTILYFALATFLSSTLVLGACSNSNDANNISTETIMESANTETVESAVETSETVTTEENPSEEAEAFIDLADGLYEAEFTTDNSMFHVNEAYNNKGIMTVEGGKATIHIVLTSKNITNLYLGLAENAKNDSEHLLMPTVETVNYSDGTTDEANAFDVPVPVLDAEFDLALIGKKEVWYDHKVSVSNPVPLTESSNEASSNEVLTAGIYSLDITLEGGSGKTHIENPSALVVNEDGSMKVTLTFSSSKYDYMLVDGEKYLPINEEGNSTFEIPVPGIDAPFAVIADTVAMSEPHEIEYNLVFSNVTAQ